jgi:hypothetical protein
VESVCKLTFRRNVSPPSSWSKISVWLGAERTVRRYIPEYGSTIHIYRCMNFKSFTELSDRPTILPRMLAIASCHLYMFVGRLLSILTLPTTGTKHKTRVHNTPVLVRNCIPGVWVSWAGPNPLELECATRHQYTGRSQNTKTDTKLGICAGQCRAGSRREPIQRRC